MKKYLVYVDDLLMNVCTSHVNAIELLGALYTLKADGQLSGNIMMEEIDDYA